MKLSQPQIDLLKTALNSLISEYRKRAEFVGIQARAGETVEDRTLALYALEHYVRDHPELKAEIEELSKDMGLSEDLF